jgi:hypothetical protein
MYNTTITKRDTDMAPIVMRVLNIAITCVEDKCATWRRIVGCNNAIPISSLLGRRIAVHFDSIASLEAIFDKGETATSIGGRTKLGIRPCERVLDHCGGV